MEMHIKNIKNLKQDNGLTVNLSCLQKETHTQSLIKGFVCVGLNLPSGQYDEYLVNKGVWERNKKGLSLRVLEWEPVPQQEATVDDVKKIMINAIVANENSNRLCISVSDYLEKVHWSLQQQNQYTSEKSINQSLLQLIADKSIILDHDKIYCAPTISNEKALARDIVRLMHFKKNIISKEVTQEAILQETNRTGIVLAREQKNSIIRTLENQVSIITGGAGTGKTTIVRFITNIYLTHFPEAKIRLLSPTGKAAGELNRGLQEHIDRGTQAIANTIHGHLGIIPKDNGGYKIVKNVTIKEAFVIIDEFSMVDLALAKELFAAIENGVKVLLLGDTQQLESVALGNVFYDLINSHVVPVSQLNRVYRQGAESLINTNASLIKRGNDELEYGDDFEFVPTGSFKESANQIIRIYLKLLETERIEDIMILSPYRQKTETGVNQLNLALRQIVNPPKPGKKEIKLDGKIYREGDRIIFTKNTKRTKNGEVGTIISIDKLVEVRLDKKDEPDIFKPDELYIDLSYAITVHKSQGAEYKCCIFTLNQGHCNMTRNLLYTAITRARNKIIIVGEKEAIKQAVAKKSGDVSSPLQKRLIEYYQGGSHDKNERRQRTV